MYFDNKAHTKIFDIQWDIEKAMNTKSGLDNKSDEFDKLFWKDYQLLVKTISEFPITNPDRSTSIIQFRNEEFAIIGRRKDGAPAVYIFKYTYNFSSNEKPSRDIKVISNNSPQIIHLGYHDAKTYLPDLNLSNNDKNESSIIAYVNNYLDIEQELHSDQVGKPYTIIKISTKDTSIIQQGNCDYQIKSKHSQTESHVK